MAAHIIALHKAGSTRGGGGRDAKFMRASSAASGRSNSLVSSKRSGGIHQWCDVMPSEDQRIKSGALEKLVNGLVTSWQPRLVVLTDEAIYLTKPEMENVILETIPLENIVKVQQEAGLSGQANGEFGHHRRPDSPGVKLDPSALLAQGLYVSEGTDTTPPSGSERDEQEQPDSNKGGGGLQWNNNGFTASFMGRAVASSPSHVRGSMSKESPRASLARNNSIGNAVDPPASTAFRSSTFIIQTAGTDKSHNRYALRANGPQEMGEWVELIQRLHGQRLKTLKAVEEAERHSKYAMKVLYQVQPRAMVIHSSSLFQSLVYVVIMASFIASAANSEMMPMEETATANFFSGLESAFTAFFTVELCINIIANARQLKSTFAQDYWNWLDIFVVAVSLVSEVSDAAPGMQILRLLRVFRIVKLFRFLSSLRRMVDALAAAMWPVMEAFGIVIVVTAIYAVLTTSLFHDRSPMHFATFSKSMFTLLHMSYGDSFMEVARSLWQCPEDLPDCAEDEVEMNQFGSWFLITYMFLCSTVLINIVITVLLDQYISAIEREKSAQTHAEREKEIEENASLRPGPLEPLIETIAFFRSPQDLKNFVTELFLVIDRDDSGSLDFMEFRRGISGLRLMGNSTLTAEDWDTLTENQTLCNDAGELTKKGFEHMIHSQLMQFVYRKLLQGMNHAPDTGHFETLMVLKLLLVRDSVPGAEPSRARRGSLDSTGMLDFQIAGMGEPLQNDEMSPGSPGLLSRRRRKYRQEERQKQSHQCLLDKLKQLQSILSSVDNFETVNLQELRVVLKQVEGLPDLVDCTVLELECTSRAGSPDLGRFSRSASPLVQSTKDLQSDARSLPRFDDTVFSSSRSLDRMLPIKPIRVNGDLDHAGDKEVLHSVPRRKPRKSSLVALNGILSTSERHLLVPTKGEETLWNLPAATQSQADTSIVQKVVPLLPQFTNVSPPKSASTLPAVVRATSEDGNGHRRNGSRELKLSEGELAQINSLPSVNISSAGLHRSLLSCGGGGEKSDSGPGGVPMSGPQLQVHEQDGIGVWMNAEVLPSAPFTLQQYGPPPARGRRDVPVVQGVEITTDPVRSRNPEVEIEQHSSSGLDPNNQHVAEALSGPKPPDLMAKLNSGDSMLC